MEQRLGRMVLVAQVANVYKHATHRLPVCDFEQIEGTVCMLTVIDLSTDQSTCMKGHQL